MCLIIEVTQDTEFSRKFLDNAWSHNPDGYGIAIPHRRGKTVEVKKGMKKKHLRHDIKALRGTHCYLHLRQATHGAIGLKYCHPFAAAPGIVCMHNGTLDGFAGDIEEKRSDSQMFVDSVLSPLIDAIPPVDRHEYIRSAAFRRAMDAIVGTIWNRLVLIDHLGSVEYGASWHTITDTYYEGMTGVRVSNTYAWSVPAKKKTNKKKTNKNQYDICASRSNSARASAHVFGHAGPTTIIDEHEDYFLDDPYRDLQVAENFENSEVDEWLNILPGLARHDIVDLCRDDPLLAADIIRHMSQ